MITRSFDAARDRAEAAAREAERLALIQLGVALEARDAVTKTARTVSDPTRRRRSLNRYERRGEQAVRKARRRTEREVNQVRRDAEHQVEGIRNDVESFADRFV